MSFLILSQVTLENVEFKIEVVMFWGTGSKD